MSTSETRIRDVMTRAVQTLDASDTLDVADDRMAAHRIRHLPVVDADAHVLGVVGRGDLFPEGLAGALGYGAVGQRKLLHVVQAKEVMSQPPVTVAPDARVWDAALLMLEKKIGCLPVVENGRLAGIVTQSDLLRCLAGGAEVEATRG